MAGLSISISWTIIEGEVNVPMKNPAHPGLLLKDDLDELGLSVAEAAKGLGDAHSLVVVGERGEEWLRNHDSLVTR